MVKFQIKAKDVSNIRKDIKKKADRKSSGPRWATNIKEAELTVRFLANPDNGGWVQFEEGWDNSARTYRVALEENEEEFKELGIKTSVRYYAPALDIENGEVIVIKLPYSLAERLTMIADKKGGGDITTVDISLYKTGAGTDTKYFADPEGKSDLDLSIHQVPDLWKLLENRVNEELGVDDDDEDELEDEVVADEAVEEEQEAPVAAKPVKRVVRRAKRA